MRKLITAAILGAGLIVCAPQLAVATEAAPSPAPAGTATPAKIALVKRMYAAMHIDKMMDGLLEQMMSAMVEAQTKAHPEVDKAKLQAIGDATRETMADFTPKIMDAMMQIYAEEFTEEELTQIDLFYESPTGQALITKMPHMMGRVMPAIMKFEPDMEVEIQAKFCAKVLCHAKPEEGATPSGKKKA